MPDTKWHHDPRIMVGVITTLGGVIVALFVQTIYLTSLFTEWKTTTDSRITQLERVDKTRENHENRIVVLEQQFTFIKDTLLEIKQAIKAARP